MNHEFTSIKNHENHHHKHHMNHELHHKNQVCVSDANGKKQGRSNSVRNVILSVSSISKGAAGLHQGVTHYLEHCYEIVCQLSL